MPEPYDKSICQWKGCSAPSTHYPKIMIPAKGWPIELHQPLGLLIGLPLCHQHCKEFSVPEFLDHPTPNGTATNRLIFDYAARGKCDPDYDRGFIQPVRMDSEEVRMLEGQQHGNA